MVVYFVYLRRLWAYECQDFLSCISSSLYYFMNHVLDFLYFTMLWHLGAPLAGEAAPPGLVDPTEIIEQCASECTFHVQTNQAASFYHNHLFI